MQVKTILNRIQRHRSFVYGPVRLVQGTRVALEVEVRPRANAWAKCSGCGKAAPGYDTLATKRFEFVPLWGVAVFLVYAMRRVACASCAVKVETVPWASGKHQLTDTYAWFLARWARRLSWKEVAGVFHTSLGEGVPLGADGSPVGSGSPAAQWNHRDRHRRDRLAARASISNACISDRRRLSAATVDRSGATREDAAAVLPLVRQGTQRRAQVHVPWPAPVALRCVRRCW